jgi:hypothetical protein
VSLEGTLETQDMDNSPLKLIILSTIYGKCKKVTISRSGNSLKSLGTGGNGSQYNFLPRFSKNAFGGPDSPFNGIPKNTFIFGIRNKMFIVYIPV